MPANLFNIIRGQGPLLQKPFKPESLLVSLEPRAIRVTQVTIFVTPQMGEQFELDVYFVASTALAQCIEGANGKRSPRTDLISASLDMFGYAHALMQDANDAYTVTDNTINNNMGSNEISRVRWWQVVTTLPNRRVLSNRGQCIFYLVAVNQ